MFFFQQVRFSQHFPPKSLFFVFDFCAIFAAISSKNLFLCLIFLEISLIFPLRGICLRKHKWGICMSPKKEKKVLFSQNFMSFYRPPKKNFGPQFQYLSLENCFLGSQNQLSFYFFWNKKFICRKKCCFRRIS